MTLIEQEFMAGATGASPDEGFDDSDVDVLFDRLLLSLRLLGDRELIGHAGRFEQRLERERLTAAARVAGSSGNVSSDRKRSRGLLGDRARSRRSINRDARRAAAVAANPTLEARVANGSIAADSLDALCRAADPDNGTIPEPLIDEVDGLSPGQTDFVVDRHLEDTADCDQVNDEYSRQMQARRCRRATSPARDGRPAMATLKLEGPHSIIDRIWDQIEAAANALYQTNGGRDRPAGDHDRWEHRLFDAAVGFFDGTTAGGSRPASGAKPAVVVSISLGDLGTAPASQSGSGPISDDQLAHYAASSPIYTLLTDTAGQPLWLGRTRRHATVAQFIALAIRDRGCGLCGASVQRCEAHHVVPWNAPAEGRTDVDNLALLCGPCHRRLHRHNPTMYRRTGPNGRITWHTRPATPDETPPRRPEPVQRE